MIIRQLIYFLYVTTSWKNSTEYIYIYMIQSTMAMKTIPIEFRAGMRPFFCRLPFEEPPPPPTTTKAKKIRQPVWKKVWIKIVGSINAIRKKSIILSCRGKTPPLFLPRPLRLSTRFVVDWLLPYQIKTFVCTCRTGQVHNAHAQMSGRSPPVVVVVVVWCFSFVEGKNVFCTIREIWLEKPHTLLPDPSKWRIPFFSITYIYYL